MSKKQEGPQIAELPVAKLNPAPYNPRQISKQALKGLAASLKRFGLVEPIVVNVRGGKNVIVGGHQRFKCLVQEKRKTAFCVTVDLDKKSERLLNTTLNNPEIQGQFIAGMSAYLDKLRKSVGDKEFLRLRLAELQRKIEEKPPAEVYSFRPGEGHLTASAAAGFWLRKKGGLDRFDKYENFILDFSGGKDSTLALAWLATYFSDRNIIAVYAETGVEFPGMGAHVRTTCEFFKVKCVIAKSEVEWWDWLRAEGKWPSLMFRKCQTIFIHQVTKKVRLEYPAEKTLLLDGSRATQAVRGSKKKIDTPVSSLPNYDCYHPCFSLTDEAAAEVIANVKPPLWEGYSRGFVRSACWCCPGQCGLQAAALQEHYPGLCEDIRRWEKIIGPLRYSGSAGPLIFDDILAAGEKKREQKARKEKARTAPKPKQKPASRKSAKAAK